MTTLAEFNPVIVADCFDVFIGCINISDYEVTIVHGSGHLATASAVCFIRSFRRLSVADPTSSVLEDVRRRYRKHFSTAYKSSGSPLCYAMIKIHRLVHPTQNNTFFVILDHSPGGSFTREHVPVARGIAEGARAEYQQSQHRKVPCWTLRFALHSLSLDPLPPTPIVADCLLIIAIDLGCDVSDTGFMTSDERCVCTLQTTTALTLNQCTSGTNFEIDNSGSQNDG